MYLELRVVAAARAAAAARLYDTLLDHAAEALLLEGAAAEPRRNLVDGEVEEVYEPARATAGHGGALCGGLTCQLRETDTPGGGFTGQQPLPAVHGRWAEDDLPSHDELDR